MSRRLFRALVLATPFAAFACASPAPVITSLDPSSAFQGQTGVTLTVNGSDFTQNSVVRWNNQTLSTTFVNSSQLTASLSRFELATVGPVDVAVANQENSDDTGTGVTVVNSSNIATFTVLPFTPTSINVTPADLVAAVATRHNYTATGTLADGTRVDITPRVTWTTSDGSVAATESLVPNRVTTLAPGQVTVTATMGSVSGSTSLTVTGLPPTSITVTPVDRNAFVGEVISYKAMANFGDGSSSDITLLVTWASSDIAVANITGAGAGQTRTLGVGQTNITATLGAVIGSTTLTVLPAAVVSITVTPVDPSTVVGSSVSFMATGSFADGSTADVTGNVTWTSADTLVATMASNVASATGAGQTTITATLGTVSGSTSLTVVNPTLTSITVTPADRNALVGEVITYTATGNFSDGSSSNISSIVTWNSSNPTIASMATNVASAVGVGQATIIATLGPVSGNTTLTVSPVNPGGTVGVIIGAVGSLGFDFACWDNASSSYTVPVQISVSAGIREAVYVTARDILVIRTDTGFETFSPGQACTLNALATTVVNQALALGDVAVWDRTGTFSHGDTFNGDQIRVFEANTSGGIVELAPIDVSGLSLAAPVFSHAWFEDPPAVPTSPAIVGIADFTNFVTHGGSSSGQGGPWTAAQSLPQTLPGFATWGSPFGNDFVIGVGTSIQTFVVRSGVVSGIMPSPISANDPFRIAFNEQRSCVFGAPRAGGNVVEAFNLDGNFVLTPGTDTPALNFTDIDNIEPVPGTNLVVVSGPRTGGGGIVQMFDVVPDCVLTPRGPEFTPSSGVRFFDALEVFPMP